MPSSRQSLADHAPLLHAYCHCCERWRVVDADAFVVDFSVDADPPTARCPDCGEHGLVKARLPRVPRREPALQLLELPLHDPRYLI